MIAFRSGGRRLALYDEMPGASYEAESQREKSFPAGFQVGGEPVRKVVEFYLLQSSMTQYALVGGHFAPAPVDSLAVQVGVNPDVNMSASAFSTSIQSSVFAGLPEYLADAMFEGIADYQRDDVLPGGSLTIDRVAHDKYESSPMAVRHTAAVLVAVIVATIREGDVERALRGWYAPRP